MLVNVTRHPYSFQGDARGMPGGAGAYKEGEESPWHKALLSYCGGNEQACATAEAQMLQLAKQAGIPTLQYGVRTCWQPVNSQRMLLWARRFGKAEAYMQALGRKHFEEAKSASHTWNVVDAAEEAGLDRGEAEKFIKSEELDSNVWDSYGSTIHEKGIHSIPYFVFNSPNTDGGPFRKGKGRPHIVNGSMDVATFTAIFDKLLDEVEVAGKGDAEQ